MKMKMIKMGRCVRAISIISHLQGMGDLLHLLRAVLAEPDETREERESVVGEDQAVRQEQRLELL